MSFDEESFDDLVEAWHNGDGFGQELHDYLGLTWNEYALWVERPNTLRAIIAACDRDERRLGQGHA